MPRFAVAERYNSGDFVLSKSASRDLLEQLLLLKTCESVVCGRFTLRAPAASWCQLFLPDLSPDEIGDFVPEEQSAPRYNVAPTQSIPCVARTDVGQPRELMFARWGLVPSWADDLAIGNRMINARSETASSKPAFKRAFAKRRCLIPADGYFEWMKTGSGKQPYLIHRPDNGLLAMAGLWETNRKVADQPITTCTVLTTSANDTTAAIHDRMPVFLQEDCFEKWLDPGFREVQTLVEWMVPAPNDLLQPSPVSTRVNSPRNDDASCVEPVEISGEQQTLF